SNWVATTDQEMASVEAESHIGEGQDRLDLRWRLHIGPGLMVERGLIASSTAAVDHAAQACPGQLPRGAVVPTGGVPRARAGSSTPGIAAVVGNGGTRARAGHVRR